ncbi:glycosyltransferase family A protein [Chamaesiphon polymorphus]|uniref:Glycosyltransferase family 2 protein n=1 Tax=Chamaesiphon polymorphus CCALA 037 TaxID=2107692 RepID=A0A2T1GNW7_9CYAN|nr:glycosyltransferase family A protein [Chamaesiphon polymorphus]PSB59583.1 glycosyltransferase family 2 protein [Chamaesiphon polymorphus CCALA 037]
MSKLSIITATRSRPNLLANAIISLEAQTCQDFEWIVFNDGGNVLTRDLIKDRQLNFKHTYIDLVCPDSGFSLCYARSQGLTLAAGEIVTYLDDDNTFKSNFVEETIAFFDRHPQINYVMPIQQRRRDVIQNGKIIKRGKEFYSPTGNCTIDELLTHKQLVDSNGFSHRQDDRLRWNPNLKIYIDYEFLLQCVSYWKRESFSVNPNILVDYIQTNQGVIGSSSYDDWAKELEYLLAHRSDYSCLLSDEVSAIANLATRYRSQALTNKRISAFEEVNS